MLATVTDWLWSYVLIAALLLVGLRLTWDARFVQLRLFKEMFLACQAVSRAPIRTIELSGLSGQCRWTCGGGNIAGVAVAITLGGPGALFWMWLIALIGSHQFVRVRACPAIQAKRGSETYRGGPAYFMRLDWAGGHAGDLFGAFTRDHWLWV